MGVTNLLKLIKERAPNAVREVKVADLAGWRIGVDASIFIYQWGSVGVSRGIHGDGAQADATGAAKTVHHLGGLVSRTTAGAALGIIPVYVFDGKPPAAKTGVIAERKERKETGNGVRLSHEIFRESEELLRLMKVACIMAPSEAEAQAAVMTKLRYPDGDYIIDAVATNDIDAIVFGARRMIRGLDSSTMKSPKSTVTVIDYDEVLRGLKVTPAQLIDLAILLGSDYTETVLKKGGRAYSYKKLHDMIVLHGSIENILSAEQIIPPAKFTFVEARRDFTTPHVEAALATLSKDHIKISKLDAGDLKKIEEYLIAHGVPEARAAKMVSALAKMKEVK
jgi:flap endonuclease-1